MLAFSCPRNAWGRHTQSTQHQQHGAATARRNPDVISSKHEISGVIIGVELYYNPSGQESLYESHLYTYYIEYVPDTCAQV